MPTRRAFTLMELLVVIGIIGILAGLVFGGVTMVKKSALKAKTDSLIQQITAACISYRTATGVFPEGPGSRPTRDWDTVFKSGTDFKLVTELTDANWATVAEDLRTQLGGIGTQLPSSGLQDAWKKPLHYRPARYFPFKNGAAKKVDNEQPPANDSYQLWSVGPDGLDGAGEGSEGKDDSISWAR